MPRELPEIQVRFGLALDRLIKASNDAAARLEQFNPSAPGLGVSGGGNARLSEPGFFSNPFDYLFNKGPSGAVKVTVDESTTGSILGPVSGSLLGAAIGPLAPYSALSRVIATGLGDEAADLALRFGGSVSRTLIRESSNFTAALGSALLREISKTITQSIIPQVRRSPLVRTLESAAPEGATIEDIIPQHILDREQIPGDLVFRYTGEQSYTTAVLPTQLQTYLDEPLTAARDAAEIGLDVTLGATPVGAGILGFSYAFFGGGNLELGTTDPGDAENVDPGLLDAFLYENDPGYYQFDPETGTGYSPGYVPINNPNPSSDIERGVRGVNRFLQRVGGRISDFITPPAGAAPVRSIYPILSTRVGRRRGEQYFEALQRRYDEIANPDTIDAGDFLDPSQRVAPIEGGYITEIFRATRGAGSRRRLDEILDDFVSVGEGDVGTLGGGVYQSLLYADTLPREVAASTSDRILERAAVDEFGQFRLSALEQELNPYGVSIGEVRRTVLEDVNPRPLIGTLPRNTRVFRGRQDIYEEAYYSEELGRRVNLSEAHREGVSFRLGEQAYTSFNPRVADRFAYDIANYQGLGEYAGILELDLPRGTRYGVSRGGVRHEESELILPDRFTRYEVTDVIGEVGRTDPNRFGPDELLINEYIDAYLQGPEELSDFLRYSAPNDVVAVADDLNLLPVPNRIRRLNIEDASTLQDYDPDYYHTISRQLEDSGGFDYGPRADVYRVRPVTSGAFAGIAGLGTVGAFAGSTQEAQAAGPLFGLLPENPEDAIPTLPNLPDFPNLLSLTNQENINEGARYTAQYRPGLLAQTSIQLNESRGLLGGLGRAFPQTRGTVEPLYESLTEFQIALDESISELPFGDRIREQAIIAREEIDGLSEASDELARTAVAGLTGAITNTQGWADLLSDLPGLAQSALLEIAIIRPASNLVSDLLASSLGGFFGNIFGNRGELPVANDSHVDVYRSSRQTVVNQTVNGADPTRAEQYAREAMLAGSTP